MGYHMARFPKLIQPQTAVWYGVRQKYGVPTTNRMSSLTSASQVFTCVWPMGDAVRVQVLIQQDGDGGLRFCLSHKCPGAAVLLILNHTSCSSF